MSALAGASGVDYVRAPYAYSLLATESEGIAASDANDWHTAGATGSAAKVAIIDGGFGNLAARQSAGELPASVTTVPYCGGTMGAPEVHGTAVAEIVHEMAPAAALTLICVDTEVDLANALAYVKANGISIVNHSVGWYNTSRGDGTGAAGTPDAIVADARANGILWVNAAGNSAQEHWSGTFTDTIADGGLHDFTASDNGNSIVLFPSEQVCGFLKWDSWPVTNQDFDLYLGRDVDLMIVAGSAMEQTGSQDPTEAFCYTNPGATQSFSFLIDRFSGTSAPRFDLFVTIGDALQYRTPAGSVMEPATSPHAFAVGAVCWSNSVLEPYSALGRRSTAGIKPEQAIGAEQARLDEPERRTPGADDTGTCGASRQPALLGGCARHDSNVRPLPPQGSALSPELRALGTGQCSWAVRGRRPVLTNVSMLPDQISHSAAPAIDATTKGLKANSTNNDTIGNATPTVAEKIASHHASRLPRATKSTSRAVTKTA